MWRYLTSFLDAIIFLIWIALLRKCTKETPDLWHVLWGFFFFSKELFPLVVEEVVEHGLVVKIIFNNTAFRLPIQIGIEEGQVDLVPLVVKASC